MHLYVEPGPEHLGELCTDEKRQLERLKYRAAQGDGPGRVWLLGGLSNEKSQWRQSQSILVMVSVACYSYQSHAGKCQGQGAIPLLMSPQAKGYGYTDRWTDRQIHTHTHTHTPCKAKLN